MTETISIETFSCYHCGNNVPFMKGQHVICSICGQEHYCEPPYYENKTVPYWYLRHTGIDYKYEEEL